MKVERKREKSEPALFSLVIITLESREEVYQLKDYLISARTWNGGKPTDMMARELYSKLMII